MCIKEESWMVHARHDRGEVAADGDGRVEDVEWWGERKICDGRTIRDHAE